MVNIVIMDGHAANPGDLSWEVFEEFGNLTVYPRTSPEQVVERASGADIVLTNKVVFDAPVLSSLPRLRYIGVLATGYNVVDLEECRKRGIVVTNIPAYSTDSVAQLVFAHLLNVVDSVDHYARQNRAGRWAANADFCYWDTSLTELAGKTFGIVGLGHIGMRVAQIAQAFGMQVLALTSKAQDALPPGIKKSDLDTLLSASDVVSLHCPLTPQTASLINTDTLQRMKPTAVLINTGRGPLVDEQALAEALDRGALRAYAADVLCEEPPRNNHPLLSHPRAFITPHVGWGTLEARTRLMEIAVGNVRAFLEGRPVHVVC